MLLSATECSYSVMTSDKISRAGFTQSKGVLQMAAGNLKTLYMRREDGLHRMVAGIKLLQRLPGFHVWRLPPEAFTLLLGARIYSDCLLIMLKG